MLDLPSLKVAKCPAAVIHAQDVPKIGRVIHGSAASVTESEVRLDNGASLPFDYLVLASGSTWDDPVCSGTDAKLSDRKQFQQARHIAPGNPALA